MGWMRFSVKAMKADCAETARLTANSGNRLIAQSVVAVCN